MISIPEEEQRRFIVESDPADDLPDVHVFEVTIFGKGVGECVAMHIGLGYWCLIDSFRHPNTRRPAGLAYLERKSVDVGQQVALIVGTHLHMDHFTALGECVEACSTARVALPQAQFPDELLTLLGAIPESEWPRKLKELAYVLDSLGDRAPRLAGAGTSILPRDIARLLAQEIGVSTTFQALSPSDATISRIRRQWSMLLDGNATPDNRRIPQNETSMVLVVEVGAARVLLGADLEVSDRSGEGWEGVDDEWPANLHGKADVIKIPHHGSYNADSDLIWSNMHSQPIGVVAPYNAGRTKVPRAADLKRLSTRCIALFGTSVRPPQSRFQAIGTGEKNAILGAAGYRPIPTRFGAVRLRRSLLDERGSWHVAFFGAAGQIGIDQ